MDFRLLRHLYYFLAVAEERHFGRAAERLGMTQPPLSAQIKTLEHVLKVKLFERGQGGVKLTTEGEAVLPMVRQLLDHAERLEASVEDAKAGRTTRLSVAAVTSAMFQPLAPALSAMRDAVPNLSVTLREMDTADALSALMNEEIDIAVVRAERVNPPLQSKQLATETLVAAVPVNHELAKLQKIPLARLAQEAMVMCPRRVSPIYVDAIHAACHSQNVTLRVSHEAQSIVSQVAFVACGVGMALVPESISRLSTAGVLFRPVTPHLQIVTTAVVWNEKRHTANAQKLADLLVTDTATPI